jgi:hypothetical protein
MALCKQGPRGANEEFTLKNGQLCSTALDNVAGAALCLKPEKASPKPHHGGGGHGGEGFDCIADAKALARCQVHFSMWTIMKVSCAHLSSSSGNLSPTI